LAQACASEIGRISASMSLLKESAMAPISSLDCSAILRVKSQSVETVLRVNAAFFRGLIILPINTLNIMNIMAMAIIIAAKITVVLFFR